MLSAMVSDLLKLPANSILRGRISLRDPPGKASPRWTLITIQEGFSWLCHPGRDFDLYSRGFLCLEEWGHGGSPLAHPRGLGIRRKPPARGGAVEAPVGRRQIQREASGRKENICCKKGILSSLQIVGSFFDPEAWYDRHRRRWAVLRLEMWLLPMDITGEKFTGEYLGTEKSSRPSSPEGLLSHEYLYKNKKKERDP